MLHLPAMALPPFSTIILFAFRAANAHRCLRACSPESKRHCSLTTTTAPFMPLSKIAEAIC